MDTIRVGVVGLGHIAEDVHLPRLRNTPEIELIGVTDISERRRREIARIYNIQEYPGYADLCECKDIDAIFILTPPSTHHEIAGIACENRKHIFCEKPLALTLGQGRRMVKKAREAGVIMMIGYAMRFSSGLELLKNMLPQLGDGLKAETTLVQPLPPDKATFQYKRGLGGGALFEMGTHHVDLLRWFFGDARPTDVDMQMIGEADVSTSFSLEFNSGVTTRSTVSWEGPVAVNSVYAGSDNGYLRTRFSVHAAKEVVHFSLHNLLREAGDLGIVLTNSRDVYAKEIDHFVECVLNKQQPLTSGVEALEDLRLVCEIYSLWESK